MKDLLHEFGVSLLAFLFGLTPAALGAAVSLAYETGLTWSRSFMQMSVGIVVSYFATGVIRVLWPWGQADPFVIQAVGFVVGMIAFKATPKFIAGLSERVTDIPAAIFDRFFPPKGWPVTSVSSAPAPARQPAKSPKTKVPAKTLAGVLGSVGAALALFVMTPAEESGRKVTATVAPSGAITIKHVSGRQYLKAYLDAVGVATACDGIATKDIKLGQTYTEAQCATMLERELIVHAEGVIKCIPGIYGRANQAVAIVSLAYNVGVSMVCKSSIARFWNAGQWRAGCDFFPRYKFAGVRVLPGLVARRARERAICLKELPK